MLCEDNEHGIMSIPPVTKAQSYIFFVAILAPAFASIGLQNRLHWPTEPTPLAYRSDQKFHWSVVLALQITKLFNICIFIVIIYFNNMKQYLVES